MEFRIGPTRVTLVRAPWRAIPKSHKGYARAAGVHFDIGGASWLGFGLCTIRLRESDTEWPECIGGYLRSDLIASQALQDHARNVARIEAICDEVVSAEVQVQSGKSKPIEDLDAYLAAPSISRGMAHG